MSLAEFRAWERKCLSEAVTNAARLLSRSNGAAAASKPGSEHTTDKPDPTRSVEPRPSQQNG
jgi:hypothetical protein